MQYRTESDSARRATRLLASAVALSLGASAVSAEITGTSGAHAQIAPPTGGMPADDNVVFVWDEAQEVTLAVDLLVDSQKLDWLAPGFAPSGPFTIPAGTVVSSHILHADSPTDDTELIGSTFFGKPVLGIIYSQDLLDASDAVVGAPGVPYPTGFDFRGMEETAEQDYIITSRRAAQTTMQISTAVDQLRVITGEAFAFSLDLGSDSELADPNQNGNEVFDCGDMNLALPGGMPDTGLYFDDSSTNHEDFPAFPTAAPFSGCSLPGLTSIYDGVFDLDGFDEVGIDLRNHQQRPILRDEIPPAERQGIYTVERFVISYDDDGAAGWIDCATAERMPVESLSPSGATYGNPTDRDETWNVLLDTAAGGFPMPVLSTNPARGETGIHAQLAPNAGIEARDDDIDALDYLGRGANVYYSVDSEGRGSTSSITMRRGWIYLHEDGVDPTAVVTSADLGIPTQADLDAFEFVWIPFGSPQGPLALAVAFSVDQDDPMTVTVDESGQSVDPSLDPRALYVSYLDGSYTRLTANLQDDVDALTAAPYEAPTEPGNSYCSVNPNSTGGPSLLSASGSNSLSDADLTLVASNAPAGMTSLFYFGPQQIETPFGNGFRCVGGQTVRMAIVPAANGVFEYQVDFLAFGSTFANLGTVNFQAWERDVAGGGALFNLSNGYSITFAP